MQLGITFVLTTCRHTLPAAELSHLGVALVGNHPVHQQPVWVHPILQLWILLIRVVACDEVAQQLGLVLHQVIKAQPGGISVRVSCRREESKVIVAQCCSSREWCSSQGTSSTSMLRGVGKQYQSGCMMQQLGLVLRQVIRACQGLPPFEYAAQRADGKMTLAACSSQCYIWPCAQSGQRPARCIMVLCSSSDQVSAHHLCLVLPQSSFAMPARWHSDVSSEAEVRGTPGPVNQVCSSYIFSNQSGKAKRGHTLGRLPATRIGCQVRNCAQS